MTNQNSKMSFAIEVIKFISDLPDDKICETHMRHIGTKDDENVILLLQLDRGIGRSIQKHGLPGQAGQ